MEHHQPYTTARQVNLFPICCKKKMHAILSLFALCDGPLQFYIINDKHRKLLGSTEIYLDNNSLSEKQNDKPGT